MALSSPTFSIILGYTYPVFRAPDEDGTKRTFCAQSFVLGLIFIFDNMFDSKTKATKRYVYEIWNYESIKIIQLNGVINHTCY